MDTSLTLRRAPALVRARFARGTQQMVPIRVMPVTEVIEVADALEAPSAEPEVLELLPGFAPRATLVRASRALGAYDEQDSPRLPLVVV
jgi:hypothetical protein